MWVIFIAYVVVGKYSFYNVTLSPAGAPYETKAACERAIAYGDADPLVGSRIPHKAMKCVKAPVVIRKGE